MNTRTDFNNAVAVVIFNHSNTPFCWTFIEKITKNIVVAKGVNFSIKTGKIITKQDSYSSFLWTDPSSEEKKNH